MATIADDGVVVVPVGVELEAPACPAVSARIVRLPAGGPDLSGRKVVLVADDGPQWFRLRSLTIRGIAEPVETLTYRVEPIRVVAYDYGALREVPAPPTRPAAAQQTSASVLDAGSDPCQVFPAKLDAAVRESRVMILASRSRTGTPFAVPLWFVAHHGRIYATTSASSWAVRNVACCPRVALLLGGERDDTRSRRLIVGGCAQALPGAPPAAVLARFAWRYYLQRTFATVELQHIALWRRRLQYYRQAQAAHLVITPRTATECPVPSPPLLRNRQLGTQGEVADLG
ncbi:pyridoxamine 5'-phosphate oxidase family protein [Mycobacterium sp. ML4]